MHCPKCGADTVVSHSEVFVFNSKLVGKVTITSVEMQVCAKHPKHSRFLTPTAASYVEKRLREAEAEAVKLLPISQFITIPQAAEILGITTRKMSYLLKSRRNLFVAYDLDSTKLIYRKSVNKYKILGDGRIMLPTRGVVKQLNEKERAKALDAKRKYIKSNGGFWKPSEVSELRSGKHGDIK